MDAADRGEPGPDHYQLLGVARRASREEIAQAWRRRARAEHPDRWPAEAAEAAEAAVRFGAVAEAYYVLGDPGRRAAYDRTLAGGHGAAGMPPGVPVPVRVIRPDGATDGDQMPQPPLRVGPVWVEGPSGAPAASAQRYLRRKRDRAWQDWEWPW